MSGEEVPAVDYPHSKRLLVGEREYLRFTESEWILTQVSIHEECEEFIMGDGDKIILMLIVSMRSPHSLLRQMRTV